MNNVKEILEKVYRIIGKSGVLTKKNIKGSISHKELVYLARLGYIKKDGLMGSNYLLCEAEGLYNFGLTERKNGETELGKKCIINAHRMGFLEATYQLFLESILTEDYSKASDYLRTLLEKTPKDERKLYNFFLYLLSSVTVLPDDLMNKAKSLTLQDVCENCTKDNRAERIRSKIIISAFERNFSVAKRNFYKSVIRQEITPDEKAILELIKHAFTLDKTDEIIMQDNARNRNYEAIRILLNERATHRALGIKERCILQLIETLDTKEFLVAESDSEDFLEIVEARDYKKAKAIMNRELFHDPKKTLSTVEILLEQTLILINEKEPFNDIEKAYLNGTDSISRGDFFIAFKNFRDCLELDPNHSRANYAIFAEYADKNFFEKAFQYLKKAYENGTAEERREYREAIYLMNYLIDMPADYVAIAKTFSYEENDEVGKLCANKDFKGAKEAQAKITNSTSLTIERLAKFALYRAVYKQVLKDKKTALCMAINDNFIGIIELLENLEAKRGLDRYEKYMQTIACDILLIKETKRMPLAEPHKATFEDSLNTKDYEGALSAPDKDAYFNSVLWEPVITLLNRVPVIYREVSSDKTSSQLFDEGEMYWENGEFLKAYEYYGESLELNPNYKPAIRKIVIYGLLTKNFDLAVEYLEKWTVFKGKKENYEYNTFLYLLNHIVELPENLKEKAKTLNFDDLAELAQANDTISSLNYNVAVAILNKKFSLAASLLKREKNDRKSTEVEEALIILLTEVDMSQRIKKANLTKLLNENKIYEFIESLESIKKRTGLNNSMEASLTIAKEIVAIKSTGKVPDAKKGISNTVFSAIENHDYETAEKLNNEYLEVYSRYDEILGNLIKKVFETVREIREGSTSISSDSLIDNSTSYSEAQTFYETGKDLYKLGQFYEAFCKFEKCLELQPDHKDAAFEMFCKYCGLKAYNRALEYYRIMIQTETPKEHLENGIYLYLLNYIIDLPKELKERLEDVSIDNIELTNIPVPDIYYAKAYVACLKKNFKHALGILKDLTSLNGFNSKLDVLCRLLSEAQTFYDDSNRKLLKTINEKNYEGALQIINTLSTKYPLSILEKAIQSLLENIIKINDTQIIPYKKNYNSLTIFTAIFNRDYRRARLFNKSYCLATGSTSDIISILLEDIISSINAVKKGFSTEEDLTQEEKISIEDMCGDGLIPDIVSTIKSGVSIEDALSIYAVEEKERYIVYIMIAERYFCDGDYHAARECLTIIEEVGTRQDLLGKYYRYVQNLGEKSKKFIIKEALSTNNSQ